LRHARLHAQRLDHHLPRSADRLGHIIESHVVELVEAPRLHRSPLTDRGGLFNEIGKKQSFFTRHVLVYLDLAQTTTLPSPLSKKTWQPREKALQVVDTSP